MLDIESFSSVIIFRIHYTKKITKPVGSYQHLSGNDAANKLISMNMENMLDVYQHLPFL